MDSTDLRVAMYRLAASLHRCAAARYEFAAASARLTSTLTKLAESVQGAMDRELATHPDMAELNVQLDGWYAIPPGDQP